MRRATARRSIRYGLAVALLASCTHTPPVHLAPGPAEGAALSAPLPVELVSHRVEPGETAWAISYRYRVSTTALIAHNGIREVRFLHVGRVLEIPDSGRANGAAVHAPRPTPSEEASRASVEAAPSRKASYQVEPGNAHPRVTRHNGTSVQAFAGSHRIEDVDEVLTSGEEHLRAAEFDQALEMALQALRFLENAPYTAGFGTQIARAEMLAATVHIAHARKRAAIQSLQRALRADEHLELDPAATSPKVIGFLEEAQAELD